MQVNLLRVIENSVNIGLKGTFAPCSAVIQNVQQPILLIAEKGKHEEAITRLSRVGFDNVVGYLEGGFEAWKKQEKRYAIFTVSLQRNLSPKWMMAA
jgi:rhodanese-related sulfurtransferase